ncbi:MAG: hypothetical protein JNM90_18000, partial [Burkholderiales bacterium]|nr:hypothetical protein [Burkholderiales bacterium]
APPRLPDALTAQLRATLAKIAAEPEFKSFLEAQGSEPQPSETPEAFVSYYRSALTREAELVKKLDLKLP